MKTSILVYLVKQNISTVIVHQMPGTQCKAGLHCVGEQVFKHNISLYSRNIWNCVGYLRTPTDI